ncbi:GntR family transcriptional regulator [Listeria riparia]|uniref:GntR family transcriptional regulator n=1 Tax=Listeria riparia FSL S10-1204 TaxID=1265816 RepID=W7D4J3_9LIST|nr:GntR family transcriptional regulator [Listeria riparia]EUJ42781.1 GntR family transcriptional regulator [Listeria riparia FSL S10-1204]
MKTNKVLYQEISLKIKKNIFNGTYPVGSYIPSEPELEKIFGVSKVTIRQAVSVLAAEGYVEKQRGRGTRVISNQLFNKLSKAKSFSKIVEESGFSIRKEILNIETISHSENHVIAQAFDEKVTHIQRMYFLSEKPYIIYHHYIQKVNDVLPENLNLDHISLYQLLKENHQIVASFDDQFEVVALHSEEQALLKTDTNMALKRTRQSYNQEGTLIEYSIGIYNTKVFPYRIEYEV